jgi:lipopolysaccharide/colanic/teichoic acid biosynthesis glycosyltransferase
MADIPSTRYKYLDFSNKVPKLVWGETYYKFYKRIFDLTATIITMPFWMSIIGVIAVIIKFTDRDAPVIFSQIRTGKNGKRFKMYKFRTMVSNAEEMKKELLHLNELNWPDFKIPNDPRITKIGRFLRKTSLDELPQLFNVLRGDMTLVGPRPTSFKSDTYQVWQTERLDITPGVTGLWQINGRGKVLFDERVRMEITYIKNSSLGLDIYIIISTLISLITSNGI